MTGVRPTWYVAFILIVYLLFPFIYKLDRKTRHIGTAAIIVLSVVFVLFSRINDFAIYTNCERALTRIPVFLLGVILSNVFLNNHRINKFLVLISFIAFTFCIAVSFVWPCDILIQRYLGIPIAFSAIIFISYIAGKTRCEKPFVSRIKAITEKIGKLSFEIYISHILLIHVLFDSGASQKIHVALNYLIILALAFPLAFSISKLTTFIINKIERKSSNV